MIGGNVIQSRVALPIGALWFGRYTLPLAVGVPVLATFMRRPPRSPAGSWVPAALAGLAAAHALTFVATDRRYAVGTDGPLLSLARSEWGAAARHAAPLALAFACLVLLTRALAREARGPAPGPGRAGRRGDGRGTAAVAIAAGPRDAAMVPR